MRFSPDKQPHRPRRSPPRELLGIAEHEQDKFTFDPEVDVSVEAWEQLESDGMSSNLRAMVLTLVHPKRAEEYKKRFSIRFPEVIRHQVTQFTTDIPNFSNALTSLSWIYPELKQTMVDQQPPGLVKIFRTLTSPKEKIDESMKIKAVKEMEKLLGDHKHHINAVSKVFLFLINFFSDGRFLIEQSMQRSGLTQDDMVEAYFQANAQELLGDPQTLTNLVLVFPALREVVNKQREVMHHWKVTLHQGPQRDILGWINGEEFLNVILGYAILCASSVQFDHTGISIQQQPKNQISRKISLPARPDI